ncbi:hypothetical protein [Nocardia wallacei]|uniref:Secreted protein n=1 Tax=Nocardia wallacei TaxID=480035 RepID=A0A7G1KLA1_9NOCA|nr:hypothetical protein [Nocardia wallacei]BCK56015.1 hypothetical protein NWFMUON74_37870 [Nocardia wallacei]
MGIKRNAVRQSVAAAAVGMALVTVSGPASAAEPIDSGSYSGSGYLLEAALNAFCVLTGSRPGCWGDRPV